MDLWGSAMALACTGVCAADVLTAHPEPADNGGGLGWAIYFDLEALAGPVTLTELTTANDAYAGASFAVEVLVRDGVGLGGSASTGPGSSMAGWTSLGTVNAIQGPIFEGVSLPIDIPDILVPAGRIKGVALRFSGAAPRYFGSSLGPYWLYEDRNLRLTTGDSRSLPFQAFGSYFSPRALVS